MKVEIVIYIYGAVCASMIVFNIIYNILLRRREVLSDQRYGRIRVQLEEQFRRIRKQERIGENHLKFLRRKLRRVNILISYERALRVVTKKNPKEEVEAYFLQVEPVILYLAAVYSKREKMQAGYFAYFLSEYAVKKERPIDSMQKVLLVYASKDNLYCRVNALKALYHFGNAENVISALKIQDDGKIYINQKILTEGLLTFQGDHDALIHRLWEDFSSFSDHTKLAVLNYIRFKTGDYKEEFYEIMTNEKADKELRLSAVRYFGKYTYPPALDHLLEFVLDHDPSRWEYATVAVSSLGRYEGEKVIQALKDAIHSPNWYVRYGAAQALEAHHLQYSELFDIVNGSDRYAREMMTYRLESQAIQAAGGDGT